MKEAEAELLYIPQVKSITYIWLQDTKKWHIFLEDKNFKPISHGDILVDAIEVFEKAFPSVGKMQPSQEPEGTIILENVTGCRVKEITFDSLNGFPKRSTVLTCGKKINLYPI